VHHTSFADHLLGAARNHTTFTQERVRLEAEIASLKHSLEQERKLKARLIRECTRLGANEAALRKELADVKARGVEVVKLADRISKLQAEGTSMRKQLVQQRLAAGNVYSSLLASAGSLLVRYREAQDTAAAMKTAVQRMLPAYEHMKRIHELVLPAKDKCAEAAEAAQSALELAQSAEVGSREAWHVTVQRSKAHRLQACRQHASCVMPIASTRIRCCPELALGPLMIYFHAAVSSCGPYSLPAMILVSP
jgi:DNA repair exonuclease SbcCD ATPase subunit